MKNLFSVLKYARDYKGYTALNIVFNIFFAIFNAASLVLIVPFLELLFKSDPSNLLRIALQGPQEFSFTREYFDSITSFLLAALIVQKGKAYALILICIAVFVLTFFKNLCRYFAMFFIAPIRNGVVRDLRNRMYKKSLDLPLSYYSDERKGDLMSRMSADVQEIEWSIMQTLEMIFREPLTVIILFTMMLLISLAITVAYVASMATSLSTMRWAARSSRRSTTSSAASSCAVAMPPMRMTSSSSRARSASVLRRMWSCGVLIRIAP